MKTGRILCIDNFANRGMLDSVKLLNRDQVVAMLRKAQGDKSNVEFAREIGTVPSQITEIYKGRRDPAGAVLEHLGLAKRVVYERTA